MSWTSRGSAEREIDVDAIRWGQGSFVAGLEVRIEDSGTLEMRSLVTERRGSPSIQISSASAPRTLHGAPARRRGRWRTRGRPGDPRVRARQRPGPRAGGRDRGARGRRSPALLRAGLRPGRQPACGFVAALSLDPTTSAGVELTEDVFLRGRLRAPEASLGQLELDVKLVSFDPEAPLLADRFEPPTNRVTVRVYGRRLIPPDARGGRRDPATPGAVELRAARTPGLRRPREDRPRREPARDGRARRATRLARGAGRWIRVDARKDPLASLRLELDEEDAPRLRPR